MNNQDNDYNSFLQDFMFFEKQQNNNHWRNNEDHLQLYMYKQNQNKHSNEAVRHEKKFFFLQNEILKVFSQKLNWKRILAEDKHPTTRQAPSKICLFAVT